MKTVDDSRIEHEEAVLLLPWYVTGRLSDLDIRRMQRHLAECGRCSAEAAMQQEIKAAMCSAPSVDYTPQASLAKLMERVDAQEQRRSWLSRMVPRGPLAARSSARTWIRTLTIAAGAQAVAIIALLAVVVWFVFRAAPPAMYQTLTTVTESSAQAAAVRVVFDESLRVDEMQSLLRSIDARIVSGPTAVGAYTIHLDYTDGAARSAIEVAEWLRVQPGVRFAEPVVRRQ